MISNLSLHISRLYFILTNTQIYVFLALAVLDKAGLYYHTRQFMIQIATYFLTFREIIFPPSEINSVVCSDT
jgi:hypothetical protein